MTEETLFHEALSRPPAERAAFLDTACAGQPELRAAVEALLAAHDTSDLLGKPLAGTEATVDSAPAARRGDATGEFTPAPAGAKHTSAAAAATPATEHGGMLAAGAVIAGRYTLEEMIAEGGMGEVWLANQTEPVKRKVALKLIKPGMDSRAVLQRFEQERQALAMMDHPNIARVLDGGMTPAGQPFFVMELVSGVPLTMFCDEAMLTPGERLELFVPICHAVQHAHQKGIVHRDLKPANILVTTFDGRPVPKVIDFGVAKATAGKITDESMSTQFGSIIGTLEYMSPEQAGFSGVDIDTRADIYSLGVILYELLTGLRPIDAKRLKKAAITEMIRIIREEEPSKPSTRLSADDSLPSLAALRQTEPRKLMGMLRGDLDWVVMKCLEKERERRYETASGLARDIERYLEGNTVEARPPSASYRLRKFAWKHAAALATAAGFALLLALATAVSTWQAFRAIKAEARAKTEAGNATSEARRALLAEEQARADRDRAVNAQRQARAEADKARAINDFLTNDLLTQAEPSNNAVEDRVTLLDVLDRAAPKVGGRFAGKPAVEAAVRQALAESFHGLASWEKAEREFRATLDLARRPDADPASLYQAQVRLAHVLRHRGRVDDETLELARSGAEGLMRLLGPDDPETLTARDSLAAAYMAAGRPADAIPVFEAAFKLAEARRGPGHPTTLTLRSNLLAAYQDAGRTAESIPLLETAAKQNESALGPNNPATLAARNNLATAYRAAGRTAEAIAINEALVKNVQSVLGPNHPNTLIVRSNLAGAYRAAGRTSDAIALDETVVKQMESSLGSDNPITLNNRGYLAVAFGEAGRTAEAIALLEATLNSMNAKLGPKHPSTLTVRSNLAAAYHDTGLIAEAVAILEEVLPTLRKVSGPRHAATLKTSATLATAHESLSRWDRAEPLWREIVARRHDTVGPDSPILAGDLESLGSNLLRRHKPVDAEPPLRESLAIREKTQSDDWATFNTRSLLGGALLGQQKYTDAEPLLLQAYEGMKQREKTIPPRSKPRLIEAGERLVQLYEATNKKDDVAKWRKELEAIKSAPEEGAQKR